MTLLILLFKKMKIFGKINIGLIKMKKKKKKVKFLF